MKKLFISQPMAGRTDKEILAERKEALAITKLAVKDDVKLIDSFFEDFDGNALQILAKSIEKLAEADVAYFCAGWQNARGCRIEHECAAEYGIDRIEPDSAIYEDDFEVYSVERGGEDRMIQAYKDMKGI